jgi:hypothetical protein
MTWPPPGIPGIPGVPVIPDIPGDDAGWFIYDDGWLILGAAALGFAADEPGERDSSNASLARFLSEPNRE